MKTGYDIIIHAGQSNTQGCGFGDATSPYIPNENVCYFSDTVFENADAFENLHTPDVFEVTVASEIVFNGFMRNNFSLSFAEEYVKNGCLANGRKLLIIRTGVGGTGFLDKHWGKSDDLYLRMIGAIERAKKLEFGDNCHRFVGLLWHQGETDAMLGATEQGHYENLSGLVKGVRDCTGVEDLPFVAGDFVQHWKNSSPETIAICEPVIKAIRRVCDENACAFVESDGLLSNSQNPTCPSDAFIEDIIHFCREDINKLGKRYFAKWQEIVNRG